MQSSTLFLLTMALACSAAGQTGGTTIRLEWNSPDGKLIAREISRKWENSDRDRPDLIEIRDRTGLLIAARDLTGDNSVLDRAAWTKDGRYFVFSKEFLGGHQPWRHPVDFYSRKSRRFYSLEDSLRNREGLGAVITGEFKLKGQSTVVTTAKFGPRSLPGVRVRVDPKSPDGDKVLEIDLRWVEAHMRQTTR